MLERLGYLFMGVRLIMRGEIEILFKGFVFIFVGRSCYERG